MSVIRHIAGELTDGVQRCVVCGYIISDYRGAVHAISSDGTQWQPKGFREGEVFVKGNFTSISPIEDDFKDCEP